MLQNGVIFGECLRKGEIIYHRTLWWVLESHVTWKHKSGSRFWREKKKLCVCVCVFLSSIWLDMRREFSSSQEKIPAICHRYKIRLLIHPLSFLQASVPLFSLTITITPPRTWNILRRRVILSGCVAFISLARSRTRLEAVHYSHTAPVWTRAKSRFLFYFFDVL